MKFVKISFVEKTIWHSQRTQNMSTAHGIHENNLKILKCSDHQFRWNMPYFKVSKISSNHQSFLTALVRYSCKTPPLLTVLQDKNKKEIIRNKLTNVKYKNQN